MMIISQPSVLLEEGDGTMGGATTEQFAKSNNAGTVDLFTEQISWIEGTVSVSF
jgi:hypothetical protein